MPAFGDRLSEDDIRAIIGFFKDNWGPEERAYQELVSEQDPGEWGRALARSHPKGVTITDRQIPA